MNHDKQSQCICRSFDSTKWEVAQEHKLNSEVLARNIVSDQIVRSGTENSRTVPPDHVTRVVVVKVNPHDSHKAKNGQSGPSSNGYLRIVTNNLDVPVWLIAAINKLHWTIELYFRITKQLLGCRHLLSHNPAGATIQMYIAIIACVLILFMTGKMPTKRTFEMICFYFLGRQPLCHRLTC